MEQINYYPAYYKEFRCIADKCEDSCCAQWQIVVDDESAFRYETVSGEIGDKLRSVQEIDEDGDRVFRLDGERCPFWEKSGLCEIHRKLGEEYLCNTCSEYPRAVQDYGDFAEHDLSLSCPEAARIILSADCRTRKMERLVLEISDEEICYDRAFMNMLKKARVQIYDIIKSPEFSPARILRECYVYAEQIQDAADRSDFSCPAYEPTRWDDMREISYVEFIDSYLSREILTDEWREMLLDAMRLGDVSVYSPEFSELRIEMADFDSGYRSMFIHYIDRYWLRTAFDCDAVGKIKLMAAAYIMLRRMQMAYYVKNKELPFSASVRMVQLYSKEIEHSGDVPADF